MKIIIILLITNSLFATTKKTLNLLAPDIVSVFYNDKLSHEVSFTESEHLLGREARIIKSVTECMGYKVNITLVPYGRHSRWFIQNKNFDAVATISSDSLQKNYFRTNSHIQYSNGVSTLYELNKEIVNLEDLKGLRVISFVGASETLPGLKKVIPLMASYVEKSNQETHSIMLYQKKVDAVISDGLIFASNTKKIKNKSKEQTIYNSPVRFNLIFNKSDFFVTFRDEKMRDSFNNCLAQREVEKALQRIEYNFMIEQVINN